MTVTKQMLRDKLVFKGPMSLTEVMQDLRLDSQARSEVLDMLMALVDSKQATLDEEGRWSSGVVIE